MFETYIPPTLGCCELVGDFENGSAEWHSARENALGGSDVAVAVGLSPWRSAYSLWTEKTGRVIPEPLTGDPVILGNLLEEPLLEMFQMKHPELEVFRSGTYRSGWKLANPDALARHRYTGEWFVIEVKTSGQIMPEIPAHYRAQVLWYQHLLKIEKAYLIGLAAGRWIEHFQEYDEFEARALEATAQRFWDSVENDVRPEWDGSESTYEAVRREVLDVNDAEFNLGDLGVRLMNAWDKFEAAEAELNLCKSAALSQMQDAKFGIIDIDEIPPHRVVSRQVGRNGIPYLRKVSKWKSSSD